MASQIAGYLLWGWVVVCFIAAFITSGKSARGERLLLITAMGLTAAADFFIILTPYGRIGVAVFIAAHFFHISRLLKWNERNRPPAAFYLLMGIFTAVCAIRPSVVIFGAVYAAFLMLAFAASHWRYHNEKSRGALLGAAGFTLFICCDIGVALYNTGIPDNFMVYIIWAFYAPSQLLIALSLYNFKRKV